jgi:hypothetical protein
VPGLSDRAGDCDDDGIAGMELLLRLSVAHRSLQVIDPLL